MFVTVDGDDPQITVLADTTIEDLTRSQHHGDADLKETETKAAAKIDFV